MKQSIFIPAIVAPILTWGIFFPLGADETTTNNSPSEETSPSMSAACPAPLPQKCTPCVGYLPAYYDLECDWGVFITGDFLYWYANESNLSYGLKLVALQPSPGSSNLTLAPRSFKNINPEWKPGFRVGIGLNTQCDGWDLYLNWTSYQNTAHNSASVADFSGIITAAPFLAPGLNQEVLLNPWVNPAVSFTTDGVLPLFNQIKAKWHLNLNQIDLELGRKTWMSRCTSFRPYIGLRGAWITTKFRTNSFRNSFNSTTSQNVSIQYKDDFHNFFWGVGIVGGVEPNWHFCQNFILFSHLDAALLWGDFSSKKKEHYQGSNPSLAYNSHWKSKFSSMQAVLDISLGLRWEKTWCCNRYRSALDIGWENHLWFDYNYRNKLLGSFNNGSTSGVSSFQEVSSNLGLGGPVLRLHFDF